MPDLDQSGNSFQKVRAYLGPSLGWVDEQAQASRTITLPGTYGVMSGDSVIFVNCNGTVNLALPDVVKWVEQTAYQPATGFERALYIKDIGGFAVGQPITINAFGTQLVDGATSASVSNAFQCLVMYPRNDLKGWWTAGVPSSFGIFTATTVGLVPASGGGTANFLRADGTWQPAGGGLAVGTSPISGGVTGRLLYDNAGILGEMTTTGTGTVVALATSPVFTTPNIDTATATSVNKVAITAPVTAATLTIANNKTLTANNTLTLAGTDATTMTFPAVNGTIAALNIADQTVTGGANVTSQSLTTGNITVDCGGRPLQFITNNGAFTITAPANDGSCIILVTNGASAGAITFTGFSVGSNTGDPLTTTNTQKFSIFVWRINGTSGYRIAAHQ